MKHLKLSLATLARSRRSPAVRATRRQTSACTPRRTPSFPGTPPSVFPEQTGTDRGGYSTLVTSYFKTAVRDQMEQRGYHFVDENPDLLVNFYAKVHERTETRPDPTFSTAYGYYGYRYGLYDAWPLYDNDVRTVTYPVGTANIDVVDARKKQMIWEGIAQGRVRDADMDNPREAISRGRDAAVCAFPGPRRHRGELAANERFRADRPIQPVNRQALRALS